MFGPIHKANYEDFSCAYDGARGNDAIGETTLLQHGSEFLLSAYNYSQLDRAAMQETQTLVACPACSRWLGPPLLWNSILLCSDYQLLDTKLSVLSKLVSGKDVVTDIARNAPVESFRWESGKNKRVRLWCVIGRHDGSTERRGSRKLRRYRCKPKIKTISM